MIYNQYTENWRLSNKNPTKIRWTPLKSGEPMCSWYVTSFCYTLSATDQPFIRRNRWCSVASQIVWSLSIISAFIDINKTCVYRAIGIWPFNQHYILLYCLFSICVFWLPICYLQNLSYNSPREDQCCDCNSLSF